MRATTTRSGWFKTKHPNHRTFTLIHTTAGIVVRLRVLKTAPLGDPAKITLDFTKHTILNTDAPRRMILPHSGGLANSNFFVFSR